MRKTLFDGRSQINALFTIGALFRRPQPTIFFFKFMYEKSIFDGKFK